MRDRLLVRHFLRRFLEHDLISPNADRHAALSVIGGMLIAFSLFLAVLIAAPYQFFPDMPPGMASLTSLDDRFFFVSASMLVMALAAVTQWDALSLDARDTAVLGALPIPRAVIVRAKFTAVAVLAIGVAVTWNLAPTLLRFVAVPPTLDVGLMGALALTLAHGATTLAAGAFGFLAVLGLREMMSVILGQAWFQRISAAVQATLVVALVTALLVLPGANANVVRNWMARGSVMTKVLPPLWFVGLHETLAGSVIDTLPRPQQGIFDVTADILQKPGESNLRFEMRRRTELSARRQTTAERDATDLYRSLWPRYRELAWRAIAAFAIVSVLTIAACLWNSRRLPMPVVRSAHKNGAAGRAWKWVAVHMIARTSLRQAGFLFTLQTLSRQISHRVALASSLAVGLSLVLMTARGRGSEIGPHITSIPLAVLAAQTLLLASVLIGFRHAVRVPAELRASPTFGLAWSGNLAPYISGVKRAGWIALVLPTLGGLFIWHATVLGIPLAVLHLGIGLVLSVLLMEMLFVSYELVPLASSYIPSGELMARILMLAAALTFVSSTLAWIERFALAAPAGYLTLVAVMMGLSAGVRAFDRASRQPVTLLDLNESTPLPTQRLDLAR